MTYNKSVIIVPNHIVDIRVLKSIVPYSFTENTHTNEPMNIATHVVLLVFLCMKIKKKKKKTRSAIFEGGEEQSAASLISKCCRGPSALQPCRLIFYSASFFASAPFLADDNLCCSSLLLHLRQQSATAAVAKHQ